MLSIFVPIASRDRYRAQPSVTAKCLGPFWGLIDQNGSDFLHKFIKRMPENQKLLGR